MLQITSKAMLIHDVSPKNRTLNLPKSLGSSQKMTDALKEKNALLPLKNYILKTKRMKPTNSSFRNSPTSKSQAKDSISSTRLDLLLVYIFIIPYHAYCK